MYKWRNFLSFIFICQLLLTSTACDSGETDEPTSQNLQTLNFTDTVIGDGLPVEAGDIVSIRYTVKSYDEGTVYDTNDDGLLFNVNLTTGIFTFIQGTNEAIEGLNAGILGMRGGGIREIGIPFNMAWGRGIEGLVPTQEDILFEVELFRKPEFTVITQGTGDLINALQVISITFDSDFYSTRPPNATVHVPYLFTVGRGHTGSIVDGFPGAVSKMAGMHLLLQDMRLGDKYNVMIPPALGLGAGNLLGVPGNTTIEAEIEVVAIN